MPFNSGGTCHRTLEALDDGPLPFAELCSIVGPNPRHFGAVLAAMKADGLVEQCGDLVGMLEAGAEALEDLRAGIDVDTHQDAKPSVRLFPYEPRRAA